MRRPAGPMPPGVETYRRALSAAGEIDAFALDPLDHFGIPVWTTTLWPREGPPQHGVGYGATDGEALRGALGELVESWSVHQAMARVEPVRASFTALARDRGPGAVLDPLSACLPAGTPYRADSVLDWVPAHRHPTGDEVLVPIELAASCRADLEGREPLTGAWLTVPITNGLGAGESHERALAHGLLELLQRDGNSVTYRALDRGVVVEPDSIEDAWLAELLAGIDEAGTELRIKLAATDFGIANVYAVGWERGPADPPHPLMVTSAGEAAHPDREHAVRKAVLEYLSSRARKAFCHGSFDTVDRVAPERYLARIREHPAEADEDRALVAMLDWVRRDARDLRDLMAAGFHAERHRVALSSLPSVRPGTLDEPAALLDHVSGALHDAGLDVLYADLSPPGGDVRVVHAIVPGLEVETATYHRVGPRNLRRLSERGDGLAGTGPPPSGAEAIAGVPGAWLDGERLDRLVGDLYPLYREPDRHLAARVPAGG